MKYALAVLAFTLAVAAPASAAFNIYVNTSPTERTCAAANIANPGYFQVDSFSFGGTLPVNNTAGKLNLQNLVIAKAFDNCSGTLITQFLTSVTIPTVKLIETTTAAPPSTASTTILTITLTNALISSYVLTDAGGNMADQEQISFTYEKACISATTTGASGGAGTTTNVCYNSETNTTTP